MFFRLNMNSLKCNYSKCDYITNKINVFIVHVLTKHSREANFQILCCYRSCSMNFNCYKKFSYHLHNDNHQEFSYNYNALSCDLCTYTFSNLLNLIHHYYRHVDDLKVPKPMKCPAKDCNYSINEKKAFKGHWCQYHSNLTKNVLRDNFIQNIDSNNEEHFDNNISIEMQPNFYIQTDGETNDLIDQNELDVVVPRGFNIHDLREYYMRTFLQYKDKYLVPESTCINILKSIGGLLDLHNRDIISQIKQNQLTYNTENLLDEHTIQYIEKNSLLMQVQNEFSSNRSRLNWIQGHPLYVAPITIKLDVEADVENSNSDDDFSDINSLYHQPERVINNFNNEDDEFDDFCLTRDELFGNYPHLLKGKKASYQYIPIKENLKALLSNKDIQKAYFDSVPKEDKTNIESFYQSDSFKSNELFKADKKSIQVKLFVDAYSNCNPLADKRKAYKVTTVQYKIGNLPRRYQGVDYFTQV